MILCYLIEISASRILDDETAINSLESEDIGSCT